MNQKNLSTLRHSTEHVLTQAMINLFGKKITMAMGPATKDGFYFDFESSQKISKSDFPKIEKEMHKIISQNLPFKHQKISIKKARELFKSNKYKQEWIDEIEKKGEKATIYYTGKKFVDLCSGPHLKSTGEIKAFKLLSVAGAYWHGDEKNKMLTRIYGTAFFDQKNLKKHLDNLEEAKKRDHRLIGKKQKLFIFDDEVGQGLPLYLPNGAMVRHLLIDFALNTYLKKGYELVSSPHIGSESLWKKSGHIGFYDDSMYGALEVDKHKYRLKPMNCPFHVKMYTHDKKSYRDLPIRWAEMGTVYRYEKSGELHGLTRPRGFTQDDAHIICTPDQLESEIENALKLTKYIYQTLGMTNLIYKLSTRDPKKLNKYVGKNKQWNQAETSLKKVLKKLGYNDYELDVGGAAFYAPKIDIDAIDSMNRRWQLSTIQIDFNLPSRFNMTYTDSNNKPKTPYMIHRALLGSIERFLGVYIEHTGGKFPLWLSPNQVTIIPITNKQDNYAKTILKTLKNNNIRVKLDNRTETLSSKIRETETQKIPYIIIIGDREVKNNQISIRQREVGDIGTLTINKFIEKIKKEIEDKVIN